MDGKMIQRCAPEELLCGRRLGLVTQYLDGFLFFYSHILFLRLAGILGKIEGCEGSAHISGPLTVCAGRALMAVCFPCQADGRGFV